MPMATQEQILFSAPGGPLGRLRTRVLLSRQPGRPQAAEGRMFVTYPQSGNGQRQVMSDHRRNMFLSFHLVVVSRDPRVRVSLSLSQAIGSRNNMLLRSDGCFPSPALPPRRKGHDMRCARPWAVLDAQQLRASPSPAADSDPRTHARVCCPFLSRSNPWALAVRFLCSSSCMLPFVRNYETCRLF